MSREKQIEEMANTINEMDEPNAHYYGRNLKQHEAFADCFTIAKHLYNAGYRKQSEGEWVEKPHFNFEGGYSGANYECSNCHFDDIYDLDNMNYCPNCGAKMKGGAE